MTAITFTIPNTAALSAWDKGLAIDDEQLAALELFFADMTTGCEALGPRYALATMALRAEYNRARDMQLRRTYR